MCQTIFRERLWRINEEVYLYDYEDLRDASQCSRRMLQVLQPGTKALNAGLPHAHGSLFQLNAAGTQVRDGKHSTLTGRFIAPTTESLHNGQF